MVMKHSRFLVLSVLVASTLTAQQPAATPAPKPAGAASLMDQKILIDPDLLAAKPGEQVILPKLVGVRLVADPAQLKDPGFPVRGVDVSHIPWFDPRTFAALPSKFLNKPASRESLHRIVNALRLYASLMGHSFVSVYLPPQDITGGFLQIVVSEAKADTKIGINGAHYFSEQSYRAVLRQKPGEPIDKKRLEEDVAWLNRNPYRQVHITAASGAAAGTTALDLDVQERVPWGLTASYDNTGTKNTDENRVSAGVTWADAFGRGDEATYRFIADPRIEHSKTHAVTYTSFLPWRHIATFSGSYTSLDTIMAPPFTQTGTSWQAGLHYEIPLPALRPGLAQNLSFGADLKYSDNNLEFASIPITNNPTEFAEGSATYGLSFAALGGQNSISVTGFVAPGGLNHYDTDTAFKGSRFGAKADFAYGTLTVAHQHPLPHGFVWNLSATAQDATGALLGSEQLNGGGSAGVRGYAESTAFGDAGVVISNELHVPPFSVVRGRDSVDLFGFVDVASLNLKVDNESTDLRSIGIGVNYQLGQHVSLRAAYGWQLKKLDHSTESSHGHIAVNVSL